MAPSAGRIGRPRITLRLPLIRPLKTTCPIRYVSARIGLTGAAYRFPAEAAKTAARHRAGRLGGMGAPADSQQMQAAAGGRTLYARAEISPIGAPADDLPVPP